MARGCDKISEMIYVFGVELKLQGPLTPKLFPKRFKPLWIHLKCISETGLLGTNPIFI